MLGPESQFDIFDEYQLLFIIYVYSAPTVEYDLTQNKKHRWDKKIFNYYFLFLCTILQASLRSP